MNILPAVLFALAYAFAFVILARTLILTFCPSVAANKPHDLYAGIGRAR